MRTTAARYCILEGWCFGAASRSLTWYEKAWEAIKGIVYPIMNACYQGMNMQTAVYAIVLSSCVAALIIYIIISRRPSIEKTTQEHQPASISNATNVCVGDSLNHLQCDYSYIANRCIKQPTEFNGRGDVHMWFTKLENFMEGQVPREQWLRVAISWMEDHCLKAIQDQYGLNMNRYEEFKRAVIERYGPHSREINVTSKQQAFRWRTSVGESSSNEETYQRQIELTTNCEREEVFLIHQINNQSKQHQNERQDENWTSSLIELFSNATLEDPIQRPIVYESGPSQLNVNEVPNSFSEASESSVEDGYIVDSSGESDGSSQVTLPIFNRVFQSRRGNISGKPTKSIETKASQFIIWQQECPPEIRQMAAIIKDPDKRYG